MKTHTTNSPAAKSASFADGRFSVSRYEPADNARGASKRAATATLPEPRSVTLVRRTAAAGGRATGVHFPGAAFPPHRTGLRALWTPTLVDRLRTPLTRYHE